MSTFEQLYHFRSLVGPEDRVNTAVTMLGKSL